MKSRWPVRVLIGVLCLIAGAASVLAIYNALPPPTLLDRDVQHGSPITSARFHHEVSNMPGPVVLDGNRVTELQNGGEAFPAMIAAIRSAKSSVNLESYIWWPGEVGQRFRAALIERARAGVPVHVLVDAIGCRLDDSTIQAMRAAGVQFEIYHPVKWYTLNRLNDRDHRKLLVVDGRVGFIGGIDIADPWDGNDAQPDHWRDMDFQVEGPAVAQMQAVFERNWTVVTGHVLLGPDYFPLLQPTGNASAQTYGSSPSSGSDDMQMMYLMAIAAARKSIDLEAAYFIPGDLLRNALKGALKRGVRVRIIVPGPYIDSRMVLDASEAEWGPMLAAGAHIYRFQPSLFHSKMMIVDGYLTMVGSTNFDERSFQLNAEANINIYDAKFGAHMTGIFDQDVAHSREISLQEWQHRSWLRKMEDWFSSLASSQL